MSSLFPFSSSSRLKGPHMKFQIGLTMDPNYGTKNVTPKTHQECAHLNPTLTSSPQKKKKKRTEIHYCPNKERIILVVKTFLCAFTLRRRSFFLFFFRDIIKSNPLLSKPSSLSISHNSLPYGICEITKRKKGFLPSLPLFLSKCYQRKNPFLFLLDKEEQGEDSPLRVGFFYCFRGERERELVAMDASATIIGGIVVGLKDKESMVDPFLVEALQNPRHRLTSKYLFFFLPQISCCKPQILILFDFFCIWV